MSGKGCMGPIVGLIVVLGILLLWMLPKYNHIVAEDEAVIKAWGNVESAYQRRADLIPNLVKTVQGAADFEKSTLTQVIEARAKATSVKIDPTNLTPEAMQQFQQAQGQLGSALGKLMVVVERYPELKANNNFLELQSQLEGTENRIKVERDRYNESVQLYNTYIRKVPNNIVAGFGGFDRKSPFAADQGAENTPDVDFDFSN